MVIDKLLKQIDDARSSFREQHGCELIKPPGLTTIGTANLINVLEKTT